MGYGVKQQMRERSNRQGAPDGTGPGGTGGADEHVGGGDHGATIIRACRKRTIAL